jgi:hypothetical protein
MLAYVLARKIQIRIRGGPGLLHNAVEQYHSLPPVYVEEDPHHAVLRQARTDLVQSVSHWAAGWHSNRPAKFDGLNVFPNQAAILRSIALSQERTGSLPASVR